MANKPKPIPWDLIELYVKAGCKQIDICKSLFLDEETLRHKVKEKYGVEWGVFSASLRSEGLMLLKGKQYEKAMKGCWPALQWLGKVDLGQREPEQLNQVATNQNQIDQTHRIMELEHQLQEALNANKPQTE